jgi:hypothetical protein
MRSSQDRRSDPHPKILPVARASGATVGMPTYLRQRLDLRFGSDLSLIELRKLRPLIWVNEFVAVRWAHRTSAAPRQPPDARTAEYCSHGCCFGRSHRWAARFRRHSKRPMR